MMHQVRRCRTNGSRRTLALVTATLLAVSVGPALCQNSPQAPARSPGLAEMLSGPLPGTAARADEDVARAVENALLGFEEVVGARVIVTGHPAGPPDDARRAAVQLSLAADAPSRSWIETVADFILQALPGVPETSLTIVDTTGTALYVRGEPLASASVTVAHDPLTPSAGVSEERTAWLFVAAIAGAALVAAVVLVRRRNGADADLPPETPAPFSFISDLTDDDLRLLLQGERAAVVAAIIELAPADAGERLRRCYDAQELPALRRPPSNELAATLERGLRAKLVRA